MDFDYKAKVAMHFFVSEVMETLEYQLKSESNRFHEGNLLKLKYSSFAVHFQQVIIIQKLSEGKGPCLCFK